MSYDHNPYASASSSNPVYTAYPSHSAHEPLQFYSSSSSHSAPGGGLVNGYGYHAGVGMGGDGQGHLQGHTGPPVSGSIHSAAGGYGLASSSSSAAVPMGSLGSMMPQGGFWSAFGTGGVEGEPPLLEELGINFDHIKDKSIAALNPFGTVDQHLMDDADLAGPLIFCFGFAMLLLFSGKPQFGYIYGLALLGDLSLYLLLNLMSPSGIDAYRVASVLGYCLLPLVLLSSVTAVVSVDGWPRYLLFAASIAWCSYSASGIFVAVLSMSEQRLLVAYPVSLFYATFALLSVFDAGAGKLARSGVMR